jgi:hypothetical protein
MVRFPPILPLSVCLTIPCATLFTGIASVTFPLTHGILPQLHVTDRRAQTKRTPHTQPLSILPRFIHRLQILFQADNLNPLHVPHPLVLIQQSLGKHVVDVDFWDAV